ncbi:MAG TPA: HAD family hydrolase [Polyangiaceae bacterium]|nr:HAD family hydrolase [Polyangiaceae bacterium]
MSLRVVRSESAPTRQDVALRGILRRCRADRAQTTPVVVFDLDGTLMDNRPRTVAILREFAARHGHLDPEIARRLEGARPHDLEYLLTDSLERLGAHRTELVAELQTFWRDRFFTDSHLPHDVALPGAVAFARACYDAGAILVYLTGRDLPLMGTGTFASLRDLGFPIGVPATELVLKPDASMPDEAFKRLAAPDLARVGHVIAAFDNEPANCNVMLAHYPDAHVVFVDTQHMPGAPELGAGVHVVRDFEMA